MGRALAVFLVALSAASPTLAAVRPQHSLRTMLGGAVDTNPRQTKLREWRGMSRPEREIRARHFYNQTWNRVAGLYGQAGKPPPAFQYGNTEGEGGQLLDHGTASASVRLSPPVVSWLAAPKFMQPKARSQARELLMHEWAHNFQNPAIFEDSNTNHREEAAQLFATYWAHRLFGAPGMGQSGPIPYANRPEASRDLASAYGKGYWRRGQFGP